MSGLVTQEEMQEFVRRIFASGWGSNLPHQPPDDNETKGGLTSTGVRCGTLIRDLPLSLKKSGEMGDKSLASRDRIEKSNNRDTALGQQMDKWRRAGAPVTW